MSARIASLIVVSGPSGAGKSTVLARVLEALTGIRFSVSHTTRAPRPGEREGVEYHFVHVDEFRHLMGEGRFLEWAEVHGHLYGTCLSEWERARAEGIDLLLDLDVQGAAQVRRRFADAVTVFILPPSYRDLERRLRGRGPADEDALQRRLAAAGEESRQFREYEYAFVNEDVDASVQILLALIQAARCRTSRMQAVGDQVLETFEAK